MISIRVAALLTAVLTYSLVAACEVDGVAAVAPAPVASAPSAEVVTWLDKLELRGKDIHAMQASVMYNKTDVLLQDDVTRTGLVRYVASDSSKSLPARFAVLFKQVVIDGGVHDQQLEYIFDGQWIIEKNYKEKTFVKRQIVAPDDTSVMNPLAIDGPFPLPLGQKRQQVLDRFHVIIDDDSTDKLLHLVLRSRDDIPQTPHRKHFDRIDLWFDKESLLPTKVTTDEETTKTSVTLTNMKLNADSAGAGETQFTAEPPKGGGWRVEIKPWKE